MAEVPDDEIFYGCGDYWENEDSVDPTGDSAIYKSRIFKMNADGRVKWYLELSGNNPDSDAGDQDRCYGLSVHSQSGYITALLQIKAREIRKSSFSPGNFYDTVLWRFDSTGRFSTAI